MAESKLDQPDFGTCARCRSPIPSGRLMLMPESNRCVRCAQEALWLQEDLNLPSTARSAPIFALPS
ncbi:MAG: TraR/DksA family transcriptional regulator [Flavobacteriales bacterium]